MPPRRRSSVWTVIAPLALLGTFAVAVLLVLGALRAPAPRAQEQPASAPTTTVAALDPSVPATYRIRKGDTLSDIAQRYGVTTDWIRSLNPQLDPTALVPGDTINLRQPAAP
ncbi:MAG: LysM peptidoglycan-binding domain-containing protein [Gaiellales bacterium]